MPVGSVCFTLPVLSVVASAGHTALLPCADVQWIKMPALHCGKSP